MKKRILSIIMVLSMCLSMLPPVAFAAEDTGLCEHHPEHTAECGYAEAVAGVDCTHEHTADCYTNGVLPEGDTDSSNAYELEGDTQQTNTLLCTHTHDEGCYVTACVHAHDGECGYTEAVSCGHAHDAECGYAPAVEEITCACTETGEGGESVHAEDCGYVAPVEETPCGHTEHTGCGYVEGAPCAHVCGEDTGCVTLSCPHVHDETCSSAGELACQHVHDDTCGYVEAVEASPCTYECELCGLTEITAWSWIDELEMLDPDTGVLALPGANERNPALFDDIVSLLPVEITATVDGGEETVALDGWACPGYPEEGAYSGNYIFTAALPEGYGLAEDAPALTVTVELGGAALFAGGTYDFSTNQSVLTINSSNLSTYNGATITGDYTLALGSDILVIDGVTVNLTIENLTLKTTGATTNGYSPIDLRNNATLNLTISGTNTLSAEFHAAGIHVPAGCTLNITSASTGTLTVNGGGGYGGGAGIGADGNGYTDGYGSTTQTCGTINIAGGTIIATGGGHYVMGTYSFGGAGIGGSTTGTEGGVASTGSITISGGNVTATGGGQAAGIGGGGSGYVQSITITGGTVKASAEYGAAIGSGQDSSTTATFTNCPTAISITGGTVTANGNIGYGGSLVGTINGGSLSIGTDASVALTDGHKIDHDSAGNYAIIPVTLNVYDGRLTDTTEWVTMNAAQGGSRIGGAGVELAVSDYHGTAKLNFVVPAGNTTGETNFTVTGDGFTATGSAALTTSGVTVNCGQQLYPVTLTFLDDAKFTSDTNDYTVSDLTVKTDGGSDPNASAIMATLPGTIEYHSASMGTMVVWLAAGTYDISVTQSTLQTDGAMTGTITVTGSATLNLLDNSSVAVLGNLDLSYGPIKFYKDGDAYKVDYYATAGAGAATTATVLVSAPFVVTQSNSDTTITTNTITVTDWGTDVPLDLTIDGLNIETSDARISSATVTDESAGTTGNGGHIDINGSAVNLNLSGSSSLKSTYETRKEVTAALVSVDGTSSLTIDGSGSLTVNTDAYGAAIGGDYASAVGTITIKGGTVTSTNTGIGAAIGTGYAGTSGGHAVITIEGGTVTANGDDGSRTAIGAAVSQGNNANTASVTIKGGEVNATGIIGASQSSATVEISGGTVNATANTSGATIGGDVYYKTNGGDHLNMSVTISGGTVNAENTNSGPAIGGSGVSDKYAAATNKTAGKVTISGGTVTATNSSNTAAAIGASGGYYFDRTDVTISGGRVTATNNATNGVAIGGGYITSAGYTDPYTYSDVTITGGTVAATGVIGSAAKVAGPESTQYATVTITGGSVNGDVWAYSDESTNVGATSDGTTSVYKITANLSSTVGTDAKVTSASITGSSYGFDDVYTDADGKIYLWLPYTGSETTATFGGADYTGEVKTDNTGVFTADKLTPTVTAPTAKTDLTYNGTAQALVTTGSTTGGTLQYAVGTDNSTAPGDDSWGTTIPTGTDAKTYCVWYKVVGDDEYADVDATCVEVTISSKTISITAKNQTVLVNSSITTGTDQVTVSDLANGHSLSEITLTGRGTGSTTTSGTITPSGAKIVDSESNDVTANYSITYANGVLTVATHTHSWSYELTATNIITATCSSALGSCPANNTVTITLTAPTGDDLIYNGSPIEATAASSSTELTAPTEITYTAKNGGTLTDNKPVNAGTYTASITVGGKTAQVTYTIAAKELPAATLSASSGNYTSSAHTPTVTVTGLTQGTDFTVTFPTDMTNGGEKTITVSGIGNYTGTQTLTYTVNPIAPTAANFNFTAPSNLTYSGTAKAAIVAPATGITGMGAVTVKYYKDGVETTPTDVGTYTVKISVAEGTNYTASTSELTDVAWTFTIGKATLTITADNKSMLTGKTLPELTCSYSGFVNGETADNLITKPTVSTNTDGKTAGSFDITVSGAEAANYEISYENGTLTVSDHVHAWTYTANDTANTITATCSAEGCPTPTQVITLAAPSGDLTYTGTAKEATVSGSIDGVATPTISYTGSLTDGKPVNAGSYTASITVEGKTVSVDIVIGNASQTAPAVSAKNETIKGAADGGITGATADMEYSTTSGGAYATIPEKLAAGTYYVRYKAKTNYDPSPDTIVTIAAGPAIAVTFNVDGGTPAPDAQSLSYKEKVTRPPDPTKTDYEFLGWYNGDTAYDFNTEVTDASLTLTAKWKQVAFTVGVDIKDGENGMEGIPVKLMKGSEVLHSGTTNSSGHIDFSHITAGAYNIVAVFGSGDTEQTRTALVTLTGDSTQTINKPLAGANSHLTVAKDTDTPAVVVGGLDTEAEALKSADNSISEISVSMDVDGKKEAEVGTTVVNAIKEQIQSDNTLKGANPVVEYLDATMVKEVKTTSGSTSTADITETQTLMELVVPFPGGRKNPVVIRYHEDENGNKAAEKMGNSSGSNEGFRVDEASETLHIYTKKFSTYAIAYTTEYTITFDPNGGDGGTTTGQTNSNGTVTLPTNLSRSGYTFKGWYTAASGGTQVTNSYVFSDDATIYAQWTQNSTGTNTGGGGGGVSTYAITVEDAEGGSVKSDRTRASYGSTVTITVTPDEGCKLDSLTVTDASGRKIEVTDKGDGKYTFKMPSGRVTVDASFVSDTAGAPCDGGADCPSAKFIDIDPNAWYHDALDYVIEHGLMGGYGNGYFGTNDDLSRGMLARILYNLEGRPAVSGDMPFTDVAADRYYFDAILWAQQNGIVGGYGGGLFGPDDPITREQLAVMLWRYAGSPAATKKELDFTDADEAGDWAVDALIWAQENGIMQGDNGAVNPKGNASRSHVAQMLKNFIENIIK